MNRHLQKIQDFIQHAATLSAEEKAVLAKAVKDTDTEITITEFKLDRTEKVKRTTAILLEETIEELEQKRKAVEEKNRDLEIEASLERVRAVAMGMRRPDDMLDICRVISSQLEILNVTDIRNVQTAIIYEAKESYVNYEYYRLHDKTLITEVAYDDHPIPAAFVKQMLEGPGAFFKRNIEGKEVKKWIEYQKTTNVFIDSYLDDANSLNYYWFSMGSVALGMSTYAPLNAANLEIFERFRNVFGLAYTRYLDVETALTQAREAKIQLALERVRARTMAMQKSNELAETSSVLFQQIKDLGFETWSCGFCIWKKNDLSEVWMAADSGGLLPPMLIPYKEEPTHRKIYEASLQGVAQHEKIWEGDDLAEHYAFLRTVPSVNNAISILESSGLALPTKQCYYVGFFKQGYLLLITTEPKDGAIALSKRFALVFEQTYTRFLDLQKAEVQAREGQIQLALERVRARTMAMQHSSELGDASFVLDSQVRNLGIETWGCAFNIYGNNESTEWFSSEAGTLPTYKTPRENLFLSYYEAGKQGESMLIRDYAGEACAGHYEYLSTIPVLGETLKSLKETGISFPARQIDHVVYFKYGYVLFITLKPSPESHDIFKRFAAVFEQTYTRFLDLQKAEAQAREGQIQLALERVRARTMAMQRSDELAETVFVLFQQFKELGEDPDQATIGIVNEDEGVIEYWVTMHGNLNKQVYKFSLEEPNVTRKIYAGWKEQKKSLVIDLAGKALSDFMYYRAGMGGAPFNEAEKRRVINVVFFSKGLINIQFTESYSEDSIRLLERFAAVFDGTYTRFLDLQKAEAQALEAVKQTSLDRVRGEIASMRTTQDLERIIPLVWNELTILGIPFLRCGVFIMDEEAELIHTHLSTPDGKALAAFDLPFDAEGIGKEILPAWRKKQMAALHWSAEEFAANTETLVSSGAVKSWGKYVTGRPDTTLELHFFPFLQGMLYAGNNLPLTDDEKDLVQSLADAFSTAYARYDDFKRLELAKQEVERTLTDLKAAQTRLIQSEKMASLGELTAGIAHEIQNPLNFVNNFSEVNQEMIDELVEELQAGNMEEALAIAADIRQNEEKINHHGKRADGIVKGMLQHSRSSAGEKQPTNLNAIADEFFKLAYHGLRAKDNTFNANLITNFDDTLPDINVLPQDIGRVMLNLFNNAFYAVSQKAKKADAGYKPTVTVTTFAPSGGGWAAKVWDNGVGISDAIKEKIMQPFFTTKPTGEGTGLGLSLTYDMVVKGHGGTIAVDTKEGEFTEFTIMLPR